MIKYLICNGYPRSGKDTFANFCVKEFEERGVNATVISSVDFVKQIATFCGWNGEKTPENRKFLSDLKDLLTQWDDVPFKKVIEAAQDFDNVCRDILGASPTANTYIFVMMREPNEIKKFVDRTGAITILIDRPDVEGAQSNHADAMVREYDYDVQINNWTTLEGLHTSAKTFVDFCLKNN